MGYKLRFHSAIPDDLVNALEYYDEVSPDISNLFRENVERRLDEIEEPPKSFPVDVPPIRFAKIGRFPYIIFFAIRASSVSIVAIVHGASNPDKWRTRKW